VQIFTRGGTQPGAEALLEAGQGHTRDASASLTTPLAGALLSVSAGYRSQQAISAFDTAEVPFANPAVDGNWNRNGTLRLDEHGALGDFSAWAWGSRNDTDFADPFSSSPSIPSTQETALEHRSQDGYGLSGAHRFGDSKLSVAASETRDDAVDVSNVPNNDPANDFPASGNDNNQFRSRNRQISLQDTTNLAPGIDFIGGVEHLNQLGSFTAFNYAASAMVLTSDERQVDSVWGGSVGRVGSQQWQVNLRNDRYSDFGSATTGLLGWGWSFAPSWKLTAQASSAFRAPSFEDLYYPGYSNPLLQPERARSVELGLRWSQGSSSASAAVFGNRISDLITAGPNQMPANVGHAAMDGAELQAATVLALLRFGASLSLDRPRDLDTGRPLLLRASYNAKLYATYRQGAWGLSADLQRTGARDDYDYVSGAIVQLSAYDLARIALQYKLNANVQLQLRVENLFNASYQLVDGYNTLPRLIIAGVQVKL
jgi:vitamin B12 transporter